MGTVIPIQELPQDLTLAPPVLGIVPTPQHSHEEPCTSPCAASHVAAPPHPAPLEELLWGALGEAHSSPTFQASFPTLLLLQHLGSGYGPGSPCPEVMPAFPSSVSLWQSLVRPGAVHWLLSALLAHLGRIVLPRTSSRRFVRSLETKPARGSSRSQPTLFTKCWLSPWREPSRGCFSSG